MTALFPKLALARLTALLCALLAMTLSAAAMAQGNAATSSEPYVYKVDRLNGGIADAPDDLYRDTPQALLESFLDAGQDGDWVRAGYALDMTHLSPAERREEGPKLAAMLYEVVRGSIVIDWSGLSDRPDAVDTTTSSKDPMAGAPRRNIRLGRIEVDGRTTSIRIARVQEPGQDPVWLFASQTVQNVPALYAAYGPTRFEKTLPAALRKPAFWTLMWWEVIALPIVILIAIAAAGLTWRAIGDFITRYDDNIAARILRAVRMPVAILAFAGTFALVRNLAFSFSGLINAILNPLQTLLIVFAAAAVFLSILEGILDRVADSQIEDFSKPDHENDRNYYTMLSAVRRMGIVIILLLGIGIVLLQTNINETLGFSLLASAGLFTVVLAFAARKLLGDIMASLQIAFSKTARIGDAVMFSGDWCYVEKIGFTHLRLRTWDNRRIIAPVGNFVQDSFENWTKKDPSLTKVAHLYLDHRADIDALREDFAEFVANDEDVINKEEAKLQVVDHTPTAMVLRLLAQSPDPQRGWEMQCRMREHMLKLAMGRDAATENEPYPAYLPREREVRID
ncbi:mechanosensitive ion channel family protein [Croceicoccus mobilis]|uniref:Mechanosensitive ion channel MscS domain-containing protein n=1 Tax=Croceicoccus mobilis TaxID=1703339 RepID=A0A916YV24_9SPHN|nr:mechanosensitive ion channel domain-containing protein [Croceicoccus mobilis]GGD62326.1 hypothetical protein GCM10010990_09680 [Croceicoccus mobilis]